CDPAVKFPSVPEGRSQEVIAPMAPVPPDTEELLERAGRGDAAARQQLLTRHRDRLRRMVALRLDRRLAARVDPSDIVQASLAQGLSASATSPSRRLLREELRDRVRAALGCLEPRDREVLVLRYLEGLSNDEAAAVLGIGESAAGMRHLRALERLRALLGEEG